MSNRTQLPSLLVVLFAQPLALTAEHLAIRGYSDGDGLPHERVARIVRDSRGLLWFCVGNYLSRFDGNRFVTSELDVGPADIVEGEPGIYWIATYGEGVYKLDFRRSDRGDPTRSPSRFRLGDTRPTQLVNRVYKDRAGRIWAGTDDGLYVLDEPDGATSFVRVELNLPVVPDVTAEVGAITEDPEGSLWIGTADGLVRRMPNGEMIRYFTDGADRIRFVRALLVDRTGLVWIGHAGGLILLKPEQASRVQREARSKRTLPVRWRTDERGGNIERPRAPGASLWMSLADARGSYPVRALSEMSDGSIVGATLGAGILVFHGGQFRHYTTRNSLISDAVLSLAEDIEANLWLGTYNSGAMRLAAEGFSGYGEVDGIHRERVLSIRQSVAGDLLVAGTKWRIHVFGGGRFIGSQLKLPPANRTSAAGGYHMYPILQDHTSAWWVGTGQGLCRFARAPSAQALARIAPEYCYTRRDGLVSDVVDVLFEDSRGDVWIGSIWGSRSQSGVTRWVRSRQTFQVFSTKDGLPAFSRARCFAEDSSGGIWIGLWDGGVLRYGDGRFHVLGTEDGVPPGAIQGLYCDTRGRMWLASSRGGAARIDKPADEHPRIAIYSTAEGLGSNNALCFTEDREQHIYVGTGRGVDRLDISHGELRHYTTLDGLGPGEVTAASRDSSGALWFGTHYGVYRFMPKGTGARLPPPVWISKVEVAGVSRLISALGETALPPLAVGHNQNRLHLEFFTLSFRPSDPNLYQYRLSDDPKAQWSKPENNRELNLASLAPGSYRVAVRAVNAAGMASTTPAVIDILIRPPVWQRWWFLCTLAAVLLGAAHALYRRRLRWLLELERVRTRIATDLHDDIGSSLSRIAILSELVRSRDGSPDQSSSQLLSEIAGTSRELIDSMSDLVWAIDPGQDYLADLTFRMRRFCEDLCGASNLELIFQVSDIPKLTTGAHLRREVYLVLKEAVSNAVRHSGCTQIRVAIGVERSALQLVVADNGGGFDVTSYSDGHGVKSIRNRATRVGGTAVWSSGRNGTSVEFRVPLPRMHS